MFKIWVNHLFLSFFIVMFQLHVLGQTKNKELFHFNSLSQVEGITISHAAGIYNQPIRLVVRSQKKAFKAILITNGNEQKIDSFADIKQPSILQITYQDSSGQPRHFVGSYIVDQGHELPVVSLVVDAPKFFPPEGIYTGYAIPDTAGGEPTLVGNAWKKRPITGFAQFFFNQKLQEELELDIKTYGGMTLGWKEKSLQLSARKNFHGQGKIHLKLFKNLPFRSYQHVVLRTSGNDQNKTRVKDMSISEVAAELNIMTKDSRPVVLYINGTYWGIHNLREKANSDYYAYRNHWEKENFEEVQGSGLRNKSYMSTYQWIKNHNQDSDFISKVKDSIDVENFMNFNIIQTYISNMDYRGNIRFYKSKTGKWRWVLYDTDLGCGLDFLNRNFIRDKTFPVNQYWYNPPYSYTMLKSLLSNDSLKEYFVQHYCYLMATYLTPDNFIAKIDKNNQAIASELDRHFMRRNHLYGETHRSWNSHVNLFKKYMNQRPASAYKHLMETFDLSQPAPVYIAQNYNHFKGLTINQSQIFSSSIDGNFFKEYPIRVNANAMNHLYEFSQWQDGYTSPYRDIIPGDGERYIAKFTHKKISPLNQKIKIDKCYKHMGKKHVFMFLSLINLSQDTIDLKNVTVYEDISQSIKSLEGVILKPGQAVVLTNDTSIFNANILRDTFYLMSFMEKERYFANTRFVLVENNKFWVDSLNISLSDSLLIEHAGIYTYIDSSGIHTIPMKIGELNTIKFGKKIIMENRSKESIFSNSRLFIGLISGGLICLIIGLFYSKRKKGMASLILIFIISTGASAQNSDETPSDLISQTNDSIKVDSNVKVIKDQFGLSSIQTRVIDNKGRGDNRFYGTRNFRVVLYDLVYRGGGNNLHLKDTIPRYYLLNPMPLSGLRQLQNVGFDKAVYLYSKNFDYWYPPTRLDSLSESGFDYVCESNLSQYLDDYLADVMRRANDTSAGLMYVHCWNGWHQSGLISAYTLMQFCDYTNAQAVKYWETCTDGNHRGFNKVITRIKEYVPSKKYYFTQEQKNRHCPCEDKNFSVSSTQSNDDKVNLKTDEMMEKSSSQQSSINTTYRKHKVKSGESLGVISEYYGMGLSELKRINRIRGTTIYIGQTLKVIDRKKRYKEGESTSKSTSSVTRHVVKSGDTLYDLSLRYKTTVAAIQKANGLKNTIIYPGQTLKIVR